MKPHSQVALIALTVIGMSACSQNINNKPQQQTSPSAQVVHKKHQKVVAPRLVAYKPRARTQNRPIYRQNAAHQQVRRPQVGGRTVKPPVRPPVRPPRTNPAQANLAELYAIGDKIFNNET
ncbi:MAG TPA: hypothetical protein EYH20_04055, partial [Leucothrix sp.]|nr:hypothetical protein [Leucothrix sp.]